MRASDQEAEQILLANMMVKPEQAPDALETVLANDFITQKHRQIFEAISEISANGDGVDAISVSEKCGMFDYVCDLVSNAAPMAVATCARIVKNNALRREGINRIDMARELLLSASDADDVIEILGAIPDGIESGKDEFMTYNEICKDAVYRLEKRFNGDVSQGLRVGFPDIDNRLGGVSPDDLVIIGGRPSMGKTAYLMNISENVCSAGGAFLFFSMEMSKEQLIDRTLSSMSGVDAKKIKSGKLEDHDWPALEAAMAKLKGMNMIIIDKPALHVQHLSNIAKKISRTTELSGIGIDYLQLMRAGEKTRFDEISTISRNLKALAKTVKAPVFALSQLSRSLESRTNRRPINSDLRESGQIEQDADIIQFLYRDEYYNEQSDQKGIVEVITSKFRNGEVGTDYLKSDLGRCRFMHLEHGYNPPEPQEESYSYQKRYGK